MRPFVDLIFRKSKVFARAGEGNARKFTEPDPFPKGIGMNTDVFSSDFR